VIDIEVEISGPGRDLHAGVDGGMVFEPFHEMIQVLASIVDGQGRVLIPGTAF
jgi:Cys-Gly metallodipeptidase DUG1